MNYEMWGFIVDVLILIADFWIVGILLREYYYDKGIYEIALVKKMQTRRRANKPTEVKNENIQVKSTGTEASGDGKQS